MATRNLKISGELWVDLLKNGLPQQIKVVKNRLPEDARCVGLDYHRPPGEGAPLTLILKIESSVFQDGDPADLPDPILQAVV
jgi:hypothetical protein